MVPLRRDGCKSQLSTPFPSRQVRHGLTGELQLKEETRTSAGLAVTFHINSLQA